MGLAGPLLSQAKGWLKESLLMSLKGIKRQVNECMKHTHQHYM